MIWTDIFIKRPVLSVVVSLLILLIGFKAATSLPIRQYPKLSNTVVNVTTVYPGASADLIQGFITTPIEQAVASAEGVDYMTSSSVLGTSTIQVYIKLNFDPNQALTEVLAKVNSVKYLIPKESNDPVVTKTTGQTTAVMYLGFSSEVLSGSAISDYLTRVVQPVLSTVDGVASADILGGQTFAMRLWLDPVRMAGRNVSPLDVSAAIAANNFQAAAGQSKGYFIVSNVSTNTDLTQSRSVQAHDRQVQGRRVRADGGHRHRRTCGAEHRCQRRLQRRARDLHRRAGDAAGQPADAGQGRPRAVSGTGAQSAAVDEDEGGLRFDQVHSVVDQRGGEDARRGDRDRRRGDLPVPRLVPLGDHSGGHHSAVADRRLQPDAGHGLQHQPPDPAGDGAGDRARRRRRHRGGGKHPPPSGGRQTSGAGRHAGRARDRRPGHLHDHHAGGGVRADRLSRRPHRRAVSRIRLHAGRLR